MTSSAGGLLRHVGRSTEDGADAASSLGTRASGAWEARTLVFVFSLACLLSLCGAAPDAKSSGCDPSLPELEGLLKLAQNYYDHGTFEFLDTQRVANVLVARKELLHICAVAVLQALLLKLEENMIYEPRAYQDVMGTYVRYLHAALQSGNLAVADLQRWPLQEGLERVEAQSQRLETRRTGTSAMVLNFCAARDRFGELHELRWLMEPPFGNPAEAEKHGGAEMGLLKETDLYIYLVDAPKCKWLGESVVQELRSVARQVHLVPYKGGPEREEQTAYFKYLSDHYDDLPDFTIFVHPDAPEHQGDHFVSLRRALKLIHTHSALAHEALQYYPLAQQIVVEPKRTWGSDYANLWIEFWDEIFDRPWHEYEFKPPRCRWVEHPGTFISGLVEGSEEGLSRGKAKAACLSAGDGCAGITCGTPPESEESKELDLDAGRRGGTCSARVGQSSGRSVLQSSPLGLETSYLRNCSAEGHSAHPDAVFPDEIPSRRTGAAAAGDLAAFSEHRGTFLEGYAEGDELERPPAATEARCRALGDACGGFTCNTFGSQCTVRAGGELLPSPVGEISYRKPSASAAPGVVGDSGGGGSAAGQRYPGPARGGPQAKFQLYTGSQAVVHRDRIRAWPRAKLAALGADGPFCSKHSGLYEAVWHAMFGEPLAQTPRELDPRLPLFLKWSIPTLYSFGDEGVI